VSQTSPKQAVHWAPAGLKIGGSLRPSNGSTYFLNDRKEMRAKEKAFPSRNAQWGKKKVKQEHRKLVRG
jgi:hypothetical protein